MKRCRLGTGNDFFKREAFAVQPDGDDLWYPQAVLDGKIVGGFGVDPEVLGWKDKKEAYDRAWWMLAGSVAVSTQVTEVSTGLRAVSNRIRDLAREIMKNTDEESGGFLRIAEMYTELVDIAKTLDSYDDGSVDHSWSPEKGHVFSRPIDDERRISAV